jgi:hypothetical protein
VALKKAGARKEKEGPPFGEEGDLVSKKEHKISYFEMPKQVIARAKPAAICGGASLRPVFIQMQ